MRFLVIIAAVISVCASAAQAEMTYLTRDGAWKLVMDAQEVARLKRERWIAVPFPEIDPQTDCKRAWREVQRAGRKLEDHAKQKAAQRSTQR